MKLSQTFRISALGLLLFVSFAHQPLHAHAANATFFGPIVPEECNCKNQTAQDGTKLTTAPDYGCVLQVVQNSINFAISAGIILTVLYIAWAGFSFILNSTNPGKRTEARTRIWNGFIGLALILSSWLIIDFLMKTFYDEGSYGPWNAILADNGNHKCIKALTPTPITTGVVGTTGSPSLITSTPPGTSSGSTATGDEAGVRSQLAAAGISINKNACPPGSTFQSVAGGCTTVGGLQQNTVKQIIQIKNICGSVQVTGGNELGHADGGQSHTTGYKVDLSTNIDSCIYGGSGGYFSSNGSRGSDARYKDKCGNEYVREPNHWDITVTSSCSK